MRSLLSLGLLVLALAGVAGCAGGVRSGVARTPDVIYVPTPYAMVKVMLTMAAVKPGEMVYDLGCGDGRIVVTAARDFGARGIGVDIDPQRIRESRENVREAGVQDRVQIRHADLFQMDFSDADVIALYLLPALNLKLRPRILDLRPGTRIVSNSFDMGDWPADQQAEDPDTGQSIYFWVVPAKVAGDWRVELPDGRTGTLALTQQFQNVAGTLTLGNTTWPLTEVALRGNELRFSAGTGSEQLLLTATAEASGRLRGALRRGQGGTTESWTAQRTE